MVAILTVSAKLATLNLLKLKIFWNEGCDVIIFAQNVTNKILSCDSNCTLDLVMWSKFGISVTSISEVILTSIL